MQESEGNLEQQTRGPLDGLAEGRQAVAATVQLRPVTDICHSVIDARIGDSPNPRDRQYVELTPPETEE
jgi:hypothetical protein